MAVEDFSDLFDPAPPDYSDIFTDAGTATAPLFDGTGLGDLDSILGGGISRQTEQNYEDPYFNPSIQRRQSEWEKAYLRADKRNNVEREIDFDMPELDAGSAGLLGLEQGGYDLLRSTAGLADMAFIPGARKVGQWAGEKSAEIDDLTSTLDNDAGALQLMSRGVTSVIPSLIAGFYGGMPAMIAAAGGQSGGAVFEDAQDGYLRQGLSEGEARNRAYVPAIAAGLVTAGITAAFGRTGVEALGKGLTERTIREMLKNPLVEIIKGAGKESIEEASDQIGQAVIEKLSFNPEKTIGEAVYEVFVAGGLGAVLGGLGEVSAAAIRKFAGTTTQPDAAPVEGVQAPDAPIDPNAPMGATPNVGSEGGFPDDLADVLEPSGEPDVSADNLGGDGSAGGIDPGVASEEEAFNQGNVGGDESIPPGGFDESQAASEPEYASADAGSTVGVRSGKQERGPKALGVRILTALGADEQTAGEFVDAYMKANPDTGPLEQFRQDILDAFNAAGLEPENSAEAMKEKAATFEGMGYSPEEAERIANDFRVQNKPKREAARARNKQRMADLKSWIKSDLTPQQREELRTQEPSEAQKESGNYRKGHITVQGMDISIENVEGSVRRGTDKGGKPWEVQMPADYGYVKGTKGKDGDAVDVYVGPDRNNAAAPVFIVDQINPETGIFDEHKILVGFPDQQTAVQVYDAAFSDGKGPTRRGAVSEVDMGWFKTWLEQGNTKKPVAYNSKQLLEGGVQPDQQQERPQEGVQEPEVQGMQVAPVAEQGAAPVAPAPAAPVEPAAPAKARTQAEEREYQELLDKKRLGSNQMRRLAILEKMAPYQKKRRGPRESWGDIIDYIEGNIGKIQSHHKARPGTEGYYTSAYKEAITKNSLKRLFSVRGSTPDTVVEDLRREGYFGQDASPDNLWEALLEAAEKRRGYRKGLKARGETLAEKQMIDFADNALEPRKGAKPVNVSTLIHGDKFKVDGEEFEVTDMEFDEETDALISVTLDDGNRFGVQIVGGNEVIYPDKGKVTSKPMEDVWDPEAGTESQPAPLPTTQDAEGQNVLDVGQGGQLAEIEGQDLDARQAQMRADMSTPMGAAPIQTQGDLLGGVPQENQDIPLFDQKPPSQVDEDEQAAIGGPDGEPSRVRRARGTPGISAMIDSAPLPANVKLVIKALLNSPLMKNADWDELRFELWDFIQSGVAGARIGRLIRISEGARSTTFVHEVMHIVFDFLPASHQQALESMRKSELKNFEAALGINLDSVLGADLAKALRNGELSSRAYMDQVVSALQKAGFPEDDFYKFTNASEFMAHYLSEKFATRAFENRNKRPQVWTQIKEWFQGVVDAIKRAIGLTPDMERMYREVFSGVYKPDLKKIVEAEEEQASFVTNPRQARNAAGLTRNQEERETVAVHQLAQSSNIVDFLTKHGATAATYATQKALGFFDYLGIRGVGMNLNNNQNEDYRALKARVTDPYQRNWMARLASVHVANFEQKMKDAKKTGDEAFKKMTSPGFLKKLARRATLEQKTNNAKLMDEAATSMLESAYKDALKVLKEEAKSDIDIAKAEGRVNELEKAMKSSTAMKMLLEDMINVLSSTPAGVAALSNPNVTKSELKKIYRDIKNSTSQPLFDDSLMDQSAYILARNQKLRDALWASQLSRNSNIRSQMGPYEKKFLADLENDPLKTLRREMRAAKKRTSDFERARFAFLELNQEVTSELEELQSQLEAGEIADNVLNDPDFKGYRKEVFDDAQVQGTQRPFMAFTDKLLVLPSGREVDVDPAHLKGAKTHFAQERQKYLSAVAELEQWLADPANAYDPNYKVHKSNLAELQAYYTSLDTLRPNDAMYLFKTALTNLRDAVEMAGGRMKGPALKSIAKWNELKRNVGNWLDDTSNDINEARQKAIRSHAVKWSEFGQNDLVWANQLWWKNVGNLLAYSRNRQSGGFKVGDKLPSGWTVKQEDMDDLGTQSKGGTKGFDIIKDDQITEDYLWNVGVYRKALKGTEQMVRRVPNEGMLTFSDMFVQERKAFQMAFRKGDQQAMAQAEQRMIALLNQNWERFDNGFAFTWDRNDDFAETTIFDGENGAFDVISGWIQQNPNAIPNFDALVDAAVSLTANVTRDEAKKILLVEIGQMTAKWHKQFNEEHEREVLPVRGTRSKNAATRSRNNAMAPYPFYEYGFKDARSIAGFAAGLHSMALDRVVGALVAMEQDLERQIAALKEVGNRKQAITRNEILRKNGDTYDSFQSLERRKSMISGVLGHLTSYDDDQDVDVTLNRLMSAQTGMLVAQVRATARNFSTGPLYIGANVNRLLGSTASTYANAFRYAWWMGLKSFAAGGKGFGKWLGKKMTYNISDIARGAQQIFKGNFRGGVDSIISGLADAVGQEALTNVKEVEDLRKAGLIHIPNYEKERHNALMGSLMYMGRLAPRQFSTTEKALSLPAMALEQPLSILRAAFPTLGDAAINAAAAGTLQSGLNAMEKRLKTLFLEWKKTGYRTFDFNNIQSEQNLFSAKELFPEKKDAEKQYLEMRKAWQEAGISFDEAATKLFKELDSGNNQAKLFNNDTIEKLTSLMIDQVNRSSAAGSPMAFRKKTFFTNLFKPFLSWKARTFQMFNRLMSIPAQTSDKRLAQIATVAFLVFFPLLAFNALLVQPAAEEADRLLAKVLHDQTKSSRQPWERDTAKSQAIGWAINSTLGIPGVDILMNFLNDMPTRASLNPDVAMIEKAKDVLRYIAGVAQTGDPMFRLSELIGGIAPDAKIILNRFESQKGKRDSNNAIALMRRHGYMELLKPMGEPVSGNSYNELSPYGPRMENAAMNGDLQELREVFNEAVQQAREMGRPEPEKAVRQLFSHRNPYDRAFKQKLTDRQRQDFLDKLSSGEREEVLEMERLFARAAQSIGATANFVKEEGGLPTPRTSTSASGNRTGGLRRGESGLRRGSNGGLRRRSN